MIKIVARLMIIKLNLKGNKKVPQDRLLHMAQNSWVKMTSWVILLLISRLLDNINKDDAGQLLSQPPLELLPL